MPDLTDRPISIVGDDFGNQSNSGGTVSFIKNLFKLPTFEFAGPFHDRALDVVCRHVQGFGIGNRLSQSRGAFRIPAANSGGNGDFLNELRKGAAAFRVDSRLFVLDTVPLRMAGHRDTPYR